MNITNRRLAYSSDMDDPTVKKDGYGNDDTSIKWVTDLADANLVTSVVLNESDTSMVRHMPVIDIDFPIEVYPSSQLGHYHLYINKEISFTKYKNILAALMNAGIVEEGFYKSFSQRGFSAVRKPGQLKPDSPKGGDVLMENAKLRLENYNLRKELDKSNRGQYDDLALECIDVSLAAVKGFLKEYPEFKDEITAIIKNDPSFPIIAKFLTTGAAEGLNQSLAEMGLGVQVNVQIVDPIEPDVLGMPVAVSEDIPNGTLGFSTDGGLTITPVAVQGTEGTWVIQQDDVPTQAEVSDILAAAIDELNQMFITGGVTASAELIALDSDGNVIFNHGNPIPSDSVNTSVENVGAAWTPSPDVF